MIIVGLLDGLLTRVCMQVQILGWKVHIQLVERGMLFLYPKKRPFRMPFTTK